MNNKFRRKLIFGLFLLVLIIIISNSWIFKTISGIDNDYYRYSNFSGLATFKEYPADRIYIDKNFLNGTNNRWGHYKTTFPKNSNDTILYRLFKKKPLKFWRWFEYANKWQYKLPYKDWQEIKKRRGEQYLRNKQFQAF
jgi:hypothetical protein